MWGVHSLTVSLQFAEFDNYQKIVLWLPSTFNASMKIYEFKNLLLCTTCHTIMDVWLSWFGLDRLKITSHWKSLWAFDWHILNLTLTHSNGQFKVTHNSIANILKMATDRQILILSSYRVTYRLSIGDLHLILAYTKGHVKLTHISIAIILFMRMTDSKIEQIESNE